MKIKVIKTKVVEDLKKVEQIRSMVRSVKKIVKDPTDSFLFRFVKRRPRFYFFSPKTALSKARRNHTASENFASKTDEVKTRLPDSILFYEDVISFPLTRGKKMDFHGGLINSNTNSLIPEAMHLNWNEVLSQELPELETPGFLSGHLPEVNNTVFYGGILFNNFGHFLLESLGRLWAYDYVRDLDPYILFYPYAGKARYLEKRNFVNQVFKGFNIPVEKIIFLDHPARIKNIIIPLQKYGYVQCKNPDSTFRKFLNSFYFRHIVPKGFEDGLKIYVSRTKLPVGSGKPIGEGLFEKYLATNGYTIFYPEQHTLIEQLTIYSRAEKIIFSDGGAIHGCILLPQLKAEVAVVARRKDNRWNTSEITDQFKGSEKEVLWIDQIKGQYQFGMETWDAISIVDWLGVSRALKNKGFVTTEMDNLSQEEYEALIQSEIFKFIRKIRRDPRFGRYLMTLKEYA